MINGKNIFFINEIQIKTSLYINSLASPSAGASALKYGDANTVTTSPGDVKGLMVP